MDYSTPCLDKKPTSVTGGAPWSHTVSQYESGDRTGKTVLHFFVWDFVSEQLDIVGYRCRLSMSDSVFPCAWLGLPSNTAAFLFIYLFESKFY